MITSFIVALFISVGLTLVVFGIAYLITKADEVNGGDDKPLP